MSVSQSTEATVEETADNLSPTSNNPDDDQEKQEPVEKTEIQAETGINVSNCSSPTLVQEEQNENPEKEKNDLLDNATMAKPNEKSPENGNIYGEEEAIPVSDDEDDADEAATISIDQQHDNQQNEYANYGKPTAAKDELDDISIAKEISQYMNANKINIGEVNDVVEMWGLCDAISAAHSGLPDSLLKDAFHFVLEGYYGHAQNHPWMRNHLDHLLRMWRKEMIKSKSTPRPTKFVSSSINLANDSAMREEGAEQIEEGKGEKEDEEPKQRIEKQQQKWNGEEEEVIKDKAYYARIRRQRKQASKRKRELASMMGVGQLLDHARRKFATEDGELDVEEDEYGNFMIGGIELDFETWGKLNKIKDAGVVHAGQPLQKRWKSSKQSENGENFHNLIAPQPPNLTPNMAEQYPTVGEVEMPEESKMVGMKGKKVKLPPKPAKEEKDEGEISSSESDKPTSSSEDEAEFGQAKEHRKSVMTKKKTMGANDGGMMRAKERRTMRREEERQQGATNAQNLQILLRKCFNLRGKIVRKLSLSQKATFMDLMKQSICGNLQPNAQLPQQHQALAQLLGGMQHRT